MKRSRLGSGSKSLERRSTFKRKRNGSAWPTYNEKECNRCGQRFMPTVGHQKYCGDACRRAANESSTSYVCEECDATFLAAAGAQRLYCSPSCASKVRSRHQKGGTGRFGKGSVAEFPKPALCVHCGEAYEQKTRAQKYCGRRCNMQDRHQQRRDGKQMWSLRSKGENKCRNCGGEAAHLHHIVPRSKSRIPTHDVVGNGLPLCVGCHRGWHDRIVAIHQHVLTDQEFATAVCFGGGGWVEHNYPDDDIVRLLRLDEIVNRRKLATDRDESFDERVTRIQEEWDFPTDLERRLPERQLEMTMNDKWAA